MKKSFLYAFCMVLASGAMWSACSSDDSESEQTTTKMEAGKTYHLTVHATKEGDTRALSLSGSDIVATWSTTENVYVKYGSDWLTGSLQPQANGSTAYLNGAITPGGNISLPAEMILQFPREGIIDYTGQDGTLATISKDYDYATATANITKIEGQNVSASEFVTFKSQQAIVKFTFQDESGNALNVSDLRISATNLHTTESTTGDITITPSPATNELYAALSGINNTQVTLTARVNTGGTDSYYVYRKNNVTFANGKYRPVTVKMSPLIKGESLSNINPGYVGWVVGSDGKVYAKTTDVPSGHNAVAMVAYVYKKDNAVHGLAIALADESGKMTQSAASTAASGHTSIPGGTWKLPSRDDWKNMFVGCGGAINGGKVNYTYLNAKLAMVGTALRISDYWSSSGDYNYLLFGETEVDINQYDEYEENATHYVRACFEFPSPSSD